VPINGIQKQTLEKLWNIVTRLTLVYVAVVILKGG